MPTLTTRDGTTIYFKDWGSGPHGITDTHKDRLNQDRLEFVTG